MAWVFGTGDLKKQYLTSLPSFHTSEQFFAYSRWLLSSSTWPSMDFELHGGLAASQPLLEDGAFSVHAMRLQ